MWKRVLCGSALLIAALSWAASPEELAREQALLRSLEIKPGQLAPLCLETPLVQEGQACGIICCAAEPAWRAAAERVQTAITETTGVRVPLVTDQELAPGDFLQRPTILLGHLDNHRYVARLYHNFFVCLDQGFTGRRGFVIRSVHNPFGTGQNAILVGGSCAEGTRRAAEAFASLVRAHGRPGTLILPRLLRLEFDPEDRLAPEIKPLDKAAAEAEIARYRQAFQSPGQGGSGASGLIRAGINFHRTGDPGWGAVYKSLMAALLEYYRTDKTINEEGMRRYDNDFRDSWTYRVAILWDLLEESGLFSDQERLDYTNLIIRLGLECVLYQGYDRPERREYWLTNTRIVHNHDTFPALGILFVGEYIKRHYRAPWAEDWIAIARGIFNGLKHTSKPLEDAAGYQWLPLMHCAIYSLAEEDPALWEEGHLKRAAYDALQVMDNAGYQAAFGDHAEELGSSGLGEILQLAAWRYQDPVFLWGAQRAANGPSHPMGQTYAVRREPKEPTDQLGIVVSPLPRPNYDEAKASPVYPPPNVPYEKTFNKLSLRASWDIHDEYLLLDGFGRGNHMHFDANAIIRYARGGVPLLCDGEYIKSAPKYHNSLVIIRDGQAEWAPAVARLDRAEMLEQIGCTQTTLVGYNGADWTRTILWRRRGYLLVADEVEARQQGSYTLRCCWRPWGEAQLADGSLFVTHPPMRLAILNVTGEPTRLERLKQRGSLPVSRFSEQISCPLKPGEGHRFVNVIVSQELAAAGQKEEGLAWQARQLRPGVILLTGPEGPEIICVGPQRLPGLRFDGQALWLSPRACAIFGGRALTIGELTLTTSLPVSLHLAGDDPAGLVQSAGEGRLTWRLGKGRAMTLRLPAGRSRVALPQGLPKEALQKAITDLAALSGTGLPSTAARAKPTLRWRNPKIVWTMEGFAPELTTLPIAEVSATPAPRADRGPVGKLFDGEYKSSRGSVMWPAGQTAVIEITLPEETFVQSVLLREWHMSADWAIKERRLEMSRQETGADFEPIASVFQEIGQESFGANVNTLYEALVGQRLRRLRLTITPASERASVYIAEAEIRGPRESQRPAITALASGDINGDGRAEIVLGSETGCCRALDEQGQILWEYVSPRPWQINSLAIADLNGDSRAEIIVGQMGEQLKLLAGTGEELWTATPPRFRGLPSNVLTVFPGDVNGDGRPEMIAGAENWQYFAYDQQGQMIWRHVIYAHAATTGCAADLDRDGCEEIIAGNAYYRLNVIDHDGRILWRSSGNIGPEMTAVAAADITGDGRPEVLAGVDDGMLHAYEALGKPLWTQNLGDKITRLKAAPLRPGEPPRLLCAAESASVFALDGTGRLIWRASLPDGVEDMALLPRPNGLVLAAACGAGVALIDARGHITALYRFPARVEKIAALPNDLLVITLSNGAAIAWRAD